jgi:hypothetical protein
VGYYYSGRLVERRGGIKLSGGRGRYPFWTGLEHLPLRVRIPLYCCPVPQFLSPTLLRIFREIMRISCLYIQFIDGARSSRKQYLSLHPGGTQSGYGKVLKDFVLGGTSGAIAKTIAAPIERVKLLLQTQENNPRLAERPYKGTVVARQALWTASCGASRRRASLPSGGATGPTW